MNFSQLLARFQDLQRYVGWTDADAERIRVLRDLVETRIDEVVDDFYAAIERHSSARRVIAGGEAQIARLRVRLRDWIYQLLSGEYDESYIERRWRVGWRHVEIGLEQQYTIVAMARVRQGIVLAARQEWRGADETLLEILDSFHRALDLDLVLIEDAYQFEYVQRQKRSDRLVAIGQMAAGIAHELRNPLNVVRTSVFYLQHAKTVAEEKRNEHMERIQRQITLADNVITALSDFARLPLPTVQFVPLRSVLTEVLDGTVLPVDVAVDLSGVPENLRVTADRRQLLIVFGNLLRNAAEAMPTGGRIAIGAHQVGDFAEVSVEDTGAGIPEDVLTHIFEPFYSTKVRGIGLGLAITRAIVENHGGHLSATSAIGQGTCFVIRLPAVETTAQPV